MAPVTFNRLLPEPGAVEADELLEAADFSSLAPSDRPYVIVNFIASADGRAAFQGRSEALGDEGDKAIFHGLRAQVDAVMAGTGTLMAERYGRILRRPERRERRVAAGRTPEPLAAFVSLSGRLPLDIPLFGEPDQRVVISTPAELDLSTVEAQVEVHRLDPDDPHPLSSSLHALRRDCGVRSLLCEGGPTLFAALLGEGLVDELFLTISPNLAGGESGPPITSGPPLDGLQAMSIAWLLQREATLYVRYRLA
jgi:riboflavin biosynthesis pyrimidine reductase